MSEEIKIRGYRVKEPKTQARVIRCDEMELIHVPTFVFRKGGVEVERLRDDEVEIPPVQEPMMTEAKIMEQSLSLQRLSEGNFGHHPNLE